MAGFFASSIGRLCIKFPDSGLDVSSFGFGLSNGCLQTNLADGTHGRRRNTQSNKGPILSIEETLLLKIWVKRTLGAALGVGNVISYHHFLTCKLTYAAHDCAFSDGKETK
mgnify:FL=1